MEERLCYLYGVGYHSFRVLKPQSDTQCRLICSTAAMCAWKSSKKHVTLANRRNLYFSMITRGQTEQESGRKKILNSDHSIQPHPPYSLDLTLRDFHHFYFLQNILNDKWFSQEDQVKMIVENFLCRKSAEFYSRGISKLPDKCQEVIHNNGEYTNDSLLNYL